MTLMTRKKKASSSEPVKTDGKMRRRVMLSIAGVAIALAAWLLWPHVAAYRHARAADEALQARDFNAAVEHLQAYAEAYPRSAQARFELARALRRAGRLDEAASVLDRSDWIPESVELERKLIAVQKHGTKGPIRQELAELGAAGHPDAPLILEASVQGDRAAMDLNAAWVWLDIWVEQFPDDWLARLWRAELLTARKEFKGARADYLKLLKLKPERHETLVALGDLAMADNAAFAEAEAYYRAAREQEPNNAAAWLGLAKSLHAQGDSVAAHPAAQRALQLDPKNAEPALVLASLSAEAGQFDPALAWLQRAKKLRGDAKRIHHLFAIVLRRIDEPEQAAKHEEILARVERANQELERTLVELLQEPDNAEHHYAVGKLHVELDKPEQAKTWFQGALQRDPGHQEARAALEELERS
jgi:tetratricopeptide (TPR) repeat protein